MDRRGHDPRWDRILSVATRLGYPDSDVLLTDIATTLGWDLPLVQTFVTEMVERYLVESDAGLGEMPTMLEGH